MYVQFLKIYKSVMACALCLRANVALGFGFMLQSNNANMRDMRV